MTKKTLRDAIGVVMRKDDRFKKDGDKWSMVNQMDRHRVSRVG